MIALLCGCNDYLDTENYTKMNSGNCPQTRDQLESLLVGCYQKLGQERDGNLLWGTILGDECFGNGRVSDIQWPAANHMLRWTDDNQHSSSWSDNYQGIFRCNSILSMQDRIEGLFTSNDDKNNFYGQVYFLRAWYYFNLARMFGPYVPLRLKPISENLPAASAESLYAQIGSDISNAVSCLPATNIKDMADKDYGHITKWAAEAVAARVFLFYTGYYNKDTLPTNSGKVTKQQVIDWLKDCVQNSGHKLLDDYRNNFTYTNSFTSKDYPYARDNHLKWIGDGKQNTEAVFVIKYSAFNKSQRGMIFGFANQTKEATYPFRDGWNATSVNPRFYEQWEKDEPNDIRRSGSVINVSDPKEGLTNYKWHIDQGEETGLYVKKFMDVNGRDANGEIHSFARLAYGLDDNQSTDANDWIEIRFSDVLLMLSEMTNDPQYMNQVRARVGLSPEPYTLDNLKRERKYELAFEGYRYWDLLRWNSLQDAGKIIDDNQNGVKYYYNGVEYEMQADFAKRLVETGGFNYLPQNEINLSDGILKQNPGWENVNTTMYQQK